MEAAVERGTAIKIVDDHNNLQGFFYCIHVNNGTYCIIAIWFKSKLAAAMMYHYAKNHTNAHCLYFQPPPDTIVVPYRFLVPDNAQRAYEATGKSIGLYIGSKEFEKLYKRWYIRLGVKEV